MVITPCTGPRLLVHPGADRAACLRALIEGARAVAADEGASSLHVLFPTAAEADELAALGLARRVSFQYHWRNEGYRAPEEFLARFDSKRRNAAKRERAAPAAQGIAITTVRGAELVAERARWARDAFQLHRSTVDKLMWGRRWLNEPFYQRVFERMSEQVEVVAARRDGELVAGAFNVSSATRLYGRYWGCFEEHKFLHFNVCLYHSIDDCIARGLSAFEGGAGGEHKLTRGFEPAETYSSHLFLERRLARPLADYIAREALDRAAQLERWRANSPILRHPRATNL
jgi:predicted N-acyltransferase